jgi:hypothetical protein
MTGSSILQGDIQEDSLSIVSTTSQTSLAALATLRPFLATLVGSVSNP